MPGACRTRSLACEIIEAHEQVTTGSARSLRHSLRNGFNGLFRALVSAKSGRMCERAVLVKPPVAGSEPVRARRPQEPVGERGTGPVSSSTRTVAWALSPDKQGRELDDGTK